MPLHTEEDWSDSDDSIQSNIETSVLLGIPDGDIDNSVDILDPSVSRIGGRPAFLPTLPLEPSSSHCKVCREPMPLLVQMWCPFEGSVMDRALYAWGCDRASCQRKTGSIRTWRGLKFNPKYAAKLERERARQKAKEARKMHEVARLEEEKKKQSVNPFSISSGTSSLMTFGLGTQLFGEDRVSLDDSETAEEPPVSDTETESDGQGQEASEPSNEPENTILQSAVSAPEWLAYPSYEPVYLSTISEYLPPPPKSNIKAEKYLQDESGQEWRMEGWEKSVNIDSVFEKFTKRVSNEPEQCVRYDLRGTPLPFSSQGEIYDCLFPSPPPAPFTTKPGFADPISQRRIFHAETIIDKCEKCGGDRVFECQLMPNLINVLRAQQSKTSTEAKNKAKPLTDEEKRKQLLSSIGMEWGTCFIFSCEKDCCEDEEGWREELVLVQWDE